MLIIRGKIGKRLRKDLTKKSIMVTYQVLSAESVYSVKHFLKIDELDKALPISDEIVDIPVSVKTFGSNIEFTYRPVDVIDEDVVEF